MCSSGSIWLSLRPESQKIPACQFQIFQNGHLTFGGICSLINACTLFLRPGMNAVAFSTYIINFSDFNLVSFMPYTYNIGTGIAPIMAPLAQPCDSHTVPQPYNPTALQPHILI